MSLSPVIPALAGVVGLLFAALVWKQWAERKKPHQLAWAGGLALYAFASFAEAWGGFSGWPPLLYRTYYVAASANVGLLGLGTVYLLSKRAGHVFAALVALLVLLTVVGQVGVAVDAATADAQGENAGAHGLPKNVAYAGFVVQGIVGGIALIVGALWSWWKTRVGGLLLIALGGLLAALGGTFETLAIVDARILGQSIAVVVMFAGFAATERAFLTRVASSASPSP